MLELLPAGTAVICLLDSLLSGCSVTAVLLPLGSGVIWARLAWTRSWLLEVRSI